MFKDILTMYKKHICCICGLESSKKNHGKENQFFICSEKCLKIHDDLFINMYETKNVKGEENGIT